MPCCCAFADMFHHASLMWHTVSQGATLRYKLQREFELCLQFMWKGSQQEVVGPQMDENLIAPKLLELPLKHAETLCLLRVPLAHDSSADHALVEAVSNCNPAGFHGPMTVANTPLGVAHGPKGWK